MKTGAILNVEKKNTGTCYPVPNFRTAHQQLFSRCRISWTHFLRSVVRVKYSDTVRESLATERENAVPNA